MVHINELYLHFYCDNRELLGQFIYGNTYRKNHQRTC